MSNELVSTGGAIVPTGDGGAGGEHVGDVSMDRGGVAIPTELARDVQNALGFDVGLEKLQAAQDVIHRHRFAQDKQQKQACTAALRKAWGSERYAERTRRIHDWLSTIPAGLARAIIDARDPVGDLIGNNPAVLRAMYEVAAGTFVSTDDERDKAAAVRTLQAEWKGAYLSNIASIKRFLDTIPRSIKEGLVNARTDDDVATMNDPAAFRWLLQLARPRYVPPAPQGGPTLNERAVASERRREIEAMMGDYSSPYWTDERMQAEYRELLQSGVPDNLVADTSDRDLTRRIGEIERWMGARTGSPEYKKYWDDPIVQREYAALLERRERGRDNDRR